MDLYFRPLKCIEVEDLMRSDVPTIDGTYEKELLAIGQYSGVNVLNDPPPSNVPPVI